MNQNNHFAKVRRAKCQGDKKFGKYPEQSYQWYFLVWNLPLSCRHE